MTPKTVAGLLAEQPEETLVQMHQSINEEIHRLQIEANLVADALSKRSRRGVKTRQPVESNGSPQRMSGVKRQDVLRVVGRVGRPVTPAQVRNNLRLEGYDISGAAVRNHLRRMVRDGLLTTDGAGHYALVTVVTNESAGPLFMGLETQSEG